MLADLWKKPIAENPISKPIASRVEFYENSLDTLNKKIAFYLLKRTEIGKELKDLSKSFRLVAATESNTSLQESMFHVADKYDGLQERLDAYVRCREQTTMMIEDARIFMVKPMKEVVNDVVTASINITAFKKKYPNSTALAPGLEQHLTDASNMMSVSAYLFEKHRVASLRTIMINLLHTEMQYHIKAIEAISPVLEEMYRVAEDESSDLTQE